MAAIGKDELEPADTWTKLGDGGFGAVFRVFWKTQKKHVAVKKLFKTDTFQEIEILKRLEHPNIVTLFGFAQDAQDLMIVLELCELGSLRSFLEQRQYKPLELPLIFDWMIQASLPIDYLRNHRIEHMDIKTDNYVITSSMILKLTDFGLSQVLEKTKYCSSQAGSWRWMPPERFSDNKLSPAFHIYALALIFWCLFTRSMPYAKYLTEYSIANAVAEKKIRPVIPSCCPKPIGELIERCWHHDRSKRPEINVVITTLFLHKSAFAPSSQEMSTQTIKRRTKTTLTQTRVLKYADVSTQTETPQYADVMTQCGKRSTVTAYSPVLHVNLATESQNTSHRKTASDNETIRKEVIMESVGIVSTKEKQKQVGREKRTKGSMESSTSDVEPVKSQVNTSTNGNGTKANDVPRQPNERSKTETTESSASDVEPGKSDLDTSTAITNGDDATARDVPRRHQERGTTGTSESRTSMESFNENSYTETSESGSESAQPKSTTSAKKDENTVKGGSKGTQGSSDTKGTGSSASGKESKQTNLDASSDSSSISKRGDGATERDASKEKKLKPASDGKHIIAKHPGKAQLQRRSGQRGLGDDKWDSQNSKQTSDRLGHQRSVDEDKQDGEPGSTSKGTIRKSVDDEQHPHEHLLEEKKEKCSEKETAGEGSGLESRKDSRTGKEAEHEGAGSRFGARNDSRTGREDKASSILNQTNDQDGARQISEETSSPVLKQEDVDQCAEVDEVIFEYITTCCKGKYDAIKTKYDVSITATKPKGSSSSRKLLVEVKQLGKTRTRTSNKTLDAHHDFIRLYSKTMADVVCKTLDCSVIKAQKITKAKAMMSKKFKDVLVHKVSNKEFIFCGKESNVTDGMREFQITAGMIGEENEYLSVDKIAFQYLKSMTSEVESIEKKYNVYFDLKELKEASSDQQQAVYIKPRISGNQKTKLKGHVTTQAKEEFISVFQSHFFALKRIQLSCQDVHMGKIQEAVNVTRSNYPTVMITKIEGSDYMLCGKDDVVQNAVKKSRRIAGLLPAGRKLMKRTTSTEGNQEHIPTSIQSNAAAASERITGGFRSRFDHARSAPDQSHREHETLPKMFPYSSHLQSHRRALTASPPDGHTTMLICQRCFTTTNVGKLESCSHTFCSDCIQRFMASTLACPECHEFYCVAVEKSLHGTMTAYRRSDIHLAGSGSPGAIFIRYQFPTGTQGPNHPRPGKPYSGTTALAYLPCDSDGLMVARRLREAFVASLTFTVQRKKSGRYEVGWSDEIPHKRSTRGGKPNYGFPDPDYMKRVNSALDKKLPSRHSADVNKPSGY